MKTNGRSEEVPFALEPVRETFFSSEHAPRRKIRRTLPLFLPFFPTDIRTSKLIRISILLFTYFIQLEKFSKLDIFPEKQRANITKV